MPVNRKWPNLIVSLGHFPIAIRQFSVFALHSIINIAQPLIGFSRRAIFIVNDVVKQMDGIHLLLVYDFGIDGSRIDVGMSHELAGRIKVCAVGMVSILSRKPLGFSLILWSR